MSYSSSSRRVSCALAVCAALIACEEATAPDAERTASLESARVPSEVVPPASFDILAVYWRGACDATRQSIVRESAEVRVTVFQRYAAPPGAVCVRAVFLDSVVVRIDPPYTLPFTVRLERGGESDTVLVVRRRA